MGDPFEFQLLKQFEQFVSTSLLYDMDGLSILVLPIAFIVEIPLTEQTTRYCYLSAVVYEMFLLEGVAGSPTVMTLGGLTLVDSELILMSNRYSTPRPLIQQRESMSILVCGIRQACES